MDDLQILIADDHATMRRSIRSILESHAGWAVCCEASNGRQAVEETRRLKPDIILLDLSMPELDGLKATQEIVEHDRNAQVLILTIHDSEAVADQARLAGAKRVISKSSAPDMLVAAIESVSMNLIHLAGSIVGRFRHIAAFFHTDADQHAVLGPFVAEGLSRGERVILMIDPSKRDAHIAWLQKAGTDLVKAEAEGTAVFISWQDVFLSNHAFDVDKMVDVFQKLLRDGSNEGFPLTRLIGLERPGDAKTVVEGESRLNYFLNTADDVVICAYDLSKFDSSVIVDVIRSHPGILIGRSLRENPFYLPPDEMIREIRERNHA